MSRDSVHQPVMVAETLEALSVQPGGVYLDATVGEGGHSAAILEASAPTGRVLGIDLDPRSLDAAAQRLQRFGQRFVSSAGNYGGMVDLARSLAVNQVDGHVNPLAFDNARDLEEWNVVRLDSDARQQISIVGVTHRVGGLKVHDVGYERRLDVAPLT